MTIPLGKYESSVNNTNPPKKPLAINDCEAAFEKNIVTAKAL
jgi:hypothetical protein